MEQKELIELYKKQIELFLAILLDIHKGNTVVNTNENINAENKFFIKKKMMQAFANNFDEKTFDIALNELLPYLRQY